MENEFKYAKTKWAEKLGVSTSGYYTAAAVRRSAWMVRTLREPSAARSAVISSGMTIRMSDFISGARIMT
jgi:hypothetical protein